MPNWLSCYAKLILITISWMTHYNWVHRLSFWCTIYQFTKPGSVEPHGELVPHVLPANMQLLFSFSYTLFVQRWKKQWIITELPRISSEWRNIGWVVWYIRLARMLVGCFLVYICSWFMIQYVTWIQAVGLICGIVACGHIVV